jgi:hypothetical protein
VKNLSLPVFCALTLGAAPLLNAAQEITLSVDAAQAGPPVNRLIFGGCYLDFRQHTDAYEELGLSSNREASPGDASARKIQPEPGQWRWEEFDQWLAWLKDNNITGVCTLSNYAPWMLGGGTTEPEDWDFFIEDWSDHAAAVVRHANIEKKAGIRYWEIWNEPDSPTFWFKQPWNSGSERYAQLFHAAVRKMKAVDPTILVGTGGMADPWRGGIRKWWTPLITEYGVGEVMDFAAIHAYYGNPANGAVDDALSRMRALMREELETEKPILVTEFNALMHEDFTQRGVSFAEQSLITALNLGLFAARDVAAAQYFCIGWWESDFCPWAPDGQPRPVVEAFKFWKDYRGNRLSVAEEGPGLGYSVACHDGDTVRLYIPVAGDLPAEVSWKRYQVKVSGLQSPVESDILAFYGDETHPLQHTLTSEDDGSVTVAFKWPAQSDALLKITLSPDASPPASK